MANLTVGVILPTTNNDHDPRKLLDFAVRAESLGYESLWVGDTLIRPVLEPLTTLAAVSSVTSKVTLGTAAILPAFRTPVHTAHVLASLDLFSGGRLTLTVGAGFPGRSEPEYAMSGVPWQRRFTRLDETVQLWRRLWIADEPVSFHGKVLRFDDVPVTARPHQPGGPKIWLGGATPRALERTGQHYDGWLPYPPNPADYAPGLAAVHRAAADAGRSSDAVTPALFVTVRITEDIETGRQALAEYAQNNYGVPLEVAQTIQLLIAGPREHIRAELERYVAAGARHIVIRIGALDISTQTDQLIQLADLLSLGDGEARGPVS
jgi:alkanesulfonate monooxygenase SsuD/methylene tetrahydromethanopterin reductase-like flavin-dependent oxidoreductase (luciferase family)